MYDAGTPSPGRSEPAPPLTKYWMPLCSVERW